MPTQPLLAYIDGPDGIASTVGSRMENNDATMPIKGANTISYKNLQDKFLMQGEGCLPLDCMFCDQTFKHPEDLGKHVLMQHRPTLCEPAVLRVEAEYLGHLEKEQLKTELPSSDAREKDNQDLSCVICGQTFDEALDVEAHMRKHKDSFTYWCNVCGRRFKEPWFLKNHMRTHNGKPGSRSKTSQGSESPITINEVVQDQITENVTSPYKICMVCGFLFPNKESLLEHTKVHTKDSVAGEDAGRGGKEGKSPRDEFLQFLNLKPRSPPSNNGQVEKPVKWIPELDPFSTYQAWQLATKGKIATGHGQIKEPGQEGSTDNDDSSSDKEEMGESWNANKVSQAETMGKTKASKSGSFTRIGNGRQDKFRDPCREVPSVDMDPKNKDKPTHCSECGKAFRTYHQLVLHSRVHKRDRKNEIEANSVDGKQQSRAASLADVVTLEESAAGERAEGGSEDGSEDGIVENLDKNEDGIEKTKVKHLGASRECSYCGKYFRSNYYLNIHLRTHTGEKPYKCEFCEYAAAQKTSLRYHLERHHKDKHAEAAADVKNGNKGLSHSQEVGFLPVTCGASETKNLKRLLEDAKEAKGSPPAKQQKGMLCSFRGTLKNATQDTKKGTDCNALNESSSVPCLENLKVEKYIIEPQANYYAVDRTEERNCASPKSVLYSGVLKGRTSADLPNGIAENAKCRLTVQESPLNLSTASFQDASIIPLSRGSLATSTCPFCTYRSLYPEVLLMHQRLMHKYNPNTVNRAGIRNRAALKARRTGCPPCLSGKDVNPLQFNLGKAKPPPSTPSKSLHMEKAKQCPTLQSNTHILSGINSSGSAPNNLKSCKQQTSGAQIGSYRQQNEIPHGPSNGPSNVPTQDRGKKLDNKVRVLASQVGMMSGNINGSLEAPMNDAAWSSNRGMEFLSNRPTGNMNLEFDGMPSKRARPDLLAPEQMDSIAFYRRGHEMGRLHIAGRYASLLPQECTHTKPASSFLSGKQGLSSEIEAINQVTILKPYETYGPGPFFSSCGSSGSQTPSTSKEGKRPVSYQHLSNAMLQKRNYENLTGSAHNRPNDKRT